MIDLREDMGISSERRGRRSRQDRDTKPSGPLKFLVRALAWGAVATIFFSMGYLSSGWLLNYLDGRGIGGQPEVVSSVEQADNLMSSSGEGIQTLVDMGKRVTFNIYVPDDKGKMIREKVEMASGVMEDDVIKLLETLLSRLSEAKVFASDVNIKNVFRDGEMMYLNFNEPFQIALSKLSAQKGSLVMTGVVRSVTDNFMPVARVQFMINGEIRESAGEVPLSVPWELRKQS